MTKNTLDMTHCFFDIYIVLCSNPSCYKPAILWDFSIYMTDSTPDMTNSICDISYIFYEIYSFYHPFINPYFIVFMTEFTPYMTNITPAMNMTDITPTY